MLFANGRGCRRQGTKGYGNHKTKLQGKSLGRRERGELGGNFLKKHDHMRTLSADRRDREKKQNKKRPKF